MARKQTRSTAGIGTKNPEQSRKGQRQYALPGDVYETALERIRWLWDEFDGNVSVNSSGGKDSTVVMQLALRVARERGDLPLRVRWLDQEAEFQSTVEYHEALVDHPDIAFDWYQVPFRLQNAVNHEDQWLRCWDPDAEEEWLRPKHPSAITENDFGTDGFHALLEAFGERQAQESGSKAVVLTGLRADESPARRLGLTTGATYKWATWGKKGRNHFVFHPIYDWGLRDVWRAIHEGDSPVTGEPVGTASWPYNAAYDFQFRYGLSPSKMRVSSLHHETSIPILFYLQEYEPETWNAITRRLQGINTAGKLGKEDYYVSDLPFMFRDWREYHDYLVENLIPSHEDRATFYKIRDYVVDHLPGAPSDPIHKELIKAVLAGDTYFEKAGQMVMAYNYLWRR